MGKCLMGKCFKQIYLTQTVLNNWIYPTLGPDRAHRHKQNCIYPQLFGFKPVLRTYALHTTSPIIEYIPPPLGLTGPTDRKTKLLISTIVWLQISFLLIYFAHNILYNCLYSISVPDRTHGHQQICILECSEKYKSFKFEKWPLNCPQGSGTLRQQLFMMHGIAWYFMVFHGIAWYCMVLHCIA